jgi:hypothetical protein
MIYIYARCQAKPLLKKTRKLCVSFQAMDLTPLPLRLNGISNLIVGLVHVIWIRAPDLSHSACDIIRRGCSVTVTGLNVPSQEPRK